MNMTSTLNQIPSWTFKANYVETCNCGYECPRFTFSIPLKHP